MGGAGWGNKKMGKEWGKMEKNMFLLSFFCFLLFFLIFDFLFL